MPISNAVVRPDLGALAFAYSLSAATIGYIADLVLPPFYTPLQTAKYPVIPAEALLEVADTARAPRTAYARGDWDFDFEDYSCSENGWEEPVDDTEAKLYRNYFDVETMPTIRFARGLPAGWPICGHRNDGHGPMRCCPSRWPCTPDPSAFSMSPQHRENRYIPFPAGHTGESISHRNVHPLLHATGVKGAIRYEMDPRSISQLVR